MTDDPNEGRSITAGMVVKEFLENEHVQAAVTRLKVKYYEEWMNEKVATEREAIHARARALDDLLLELAITQDRGQVAKANRDRRDRTNVRR